jgi:hypothetical protein
LATAAAPGDDWAASSLVDIVLLRRALELQGAVGVAGALSAEQLESAADVARAYEEQFSKSGKQHHRDSVVDALDTMIVLSDDPLVRSWLQEIRSRLSSEAGPAEA